MPPSGQHHVARREGFMTTPNGRVMFIAAHPDDPDFLAGGTVVRLAQEGREVAYVILTNGNKGSGNRSVTSEQLASIRAEEQRRAAQVLGVGDVEFLGYEDGELEDTRDLRRDVTREIRRWRPNLIITLNPHRTYNNFPGWHRDHRVTGRVVLDWNEKAFRFYRRLGAKPAKQWVLTRLSGKPLRRLAARKRT
jgi:LmbE family N-acetylglucosaminyl deacetylase